MDLPDLVIVLSRVSEPGNVGAVCRAMKNMGLSRLRIAGIEASANPGRFSAQETALLRARAVHAADIWEKAEFFDSLGPALADMSLTIGITRRRGHRRKPVTMDSRTLAAWLREKPGSAALVFGNERTGLEDHELALCNLASHIPSSGAFPSLNLSHAVQIYAYELFLALETGPDAAVAGPDAVKGAWVPLTHAQAAELSLSITNTLESLGFYRHPGREIQERFLRDLICRAGLTAREGKYLEDMFAKAGRLGAQ
ncbi:MAG: RNA methyltransferase [Treponema sp.]|jgi:tRNA/rRNA methyltransferase/tRNA (cytidine32/uridine32-2'-O)-methyltransferase|nr:RNA methyltransferase [Treponema sp.]